jgi:VWFA-related protein
MQRVHTLLEQFFEKEFGQNDRAAITTGSGQLGFLEQMTGDKSVILTAIGRLRPQTLANRDVERPPMTDLQAQAIARYDSDVTDFFVDRFMADNPGFPRNSAVELVRKRAIVLLQQSSAVTKNSLQSLYSLIRFVGGMPERKLLFFISDGFLIDDQTSNVSATLRRITDAAARAGVVVYAIDARGLSTGIPDPTMGGGNDPGERLTRTTANETTATQAPLRALSADTGGRALLNTNALASSASTALRETDAYYVLAWRPDEEQEANKFRRIEVSIVGRPELIVRVRRGFLERESKSDSPSSTNSSSQPTKALTTDDKLRSAILSPFPLNALPTSVFVSYANDRELGSYVTISMEMDGEALSFVPKSGKQTAMVEVAGIVFDDKRKAAASFKSQLTVNPPATTSASSQKRAFAFNHQTRLKPGLYQVRVAAFDSQSGRSGSATQWIVIPDLSLNRLSLSSVTIGEHPTEKAADQTDASATESVFLSISRRFARSSSLRFLTFVYNASQGVGGNDPPDVVIQVQIFRDNQPVLTTELSKIDTQGIQDMKRLPFAADIPLTSMPSGRYRLQVTVVDRIAKTSASQYVNFEIG